MTVFVIAFVTVLVTVGCRWLNLDEDLGEDLGEDMELVVVCRGLEKRVVALAPILPCYSVREGCANDERDNSITAVHGVKDTCARLRLHSAHELHEHGDFSRCHRPDLGGNATRSRLTRFRGNKPDQAKPGQAIHPSRLAICCCQHEHRPGSRSRSRWGAAQQH